MKTIICPVDFSQVSDNAVSYANELARHFHATLVFVHAFYYPVIMPENIAVLDSTAVFAKEECAKDMLDQLCHRLRRKDSSGLVNYEYKIMYGFIGDELPRYAIERNADMIVIGTGGAEGLRKALVGSIAASFIDKTMIPILIVPRTVRYQSIKEIVYASDMHSDNVYEINRLLEIVASYKAHLSFVTFADDRDIAHSQEELSDYVSRRLPEKNDIALSCEVIKKDRLLHDMLEYAERKKADMMVMTRRQRNFIHRMLSRSATHELTYASVLPVLVYHAAG